MCKTRHSQLGFVFFFSLSIILCDCQFACYLPSKTAFATRYGTKTSRCATSSFGHLNVWGSKIIGIYIKHVLITYGSFYGNFSCLVQIGLLGVYVQKQPQIPSTILWHHQRPDLTANCVAVSWRGQPQAVSVHSFSPSSLPVCLACTSASTNACTGADPPGSYPILIFDVLDDRQLRHCFLDPQSGESSSRVSIPTLSHQFAHHAHSLTKKAEDRNIT